MNHDLKNTWEIYVSSWKAELRAEKIALYKDCLTDNNIYTDPTIIANGWEELADYMLNFHQQVTGGHFVTRYFLAHHKQSIARWDMCDGTGSILGEGISYATYNDAGLLISETGFFEAP
jgi:hypothetical protein